LVDHGANIKYSYTKDKHTYSVKESLKKAEKKSKFELSALKQISKEIRELKLSME